MQTRATTCSKYSGAIQNIETLRKAAAGQAIFSLAPDRDGLVRRVPALISAGDVIVPSLALELLRVATGGNAIAVKTDDAGIKSVVVGRCGHSHGPERPPLDSLCAAGTGKKPFRPGIS